MDLIYSQSDPDQTQTGQLNTSLGETRGQGINWRGWEKLRERLMVQQGQSIIHKWSAENVPFVIERVVHLGPDATHEAVLEVFGMCQQCVCVCVIYYPKTQLMIFQPQDIRED